MAAAKDGAFGTEREIIVYPGSRIGEVEDIAGKTMAFMIAQAECPHIWI